MSEFDMPEGDDPGVPDAGELAGGGAAFRPAGMPALVAGARDALWSRAVGETELLTDAEVEARLRGGASVLVCHARAAARMLKTAPFVALDLLELYAFVRPARFALPNPRGLAQALGLPLPASRAQEAESLRAAAAALLAELAALSDDARAQAARIAWPMARAGWPWGARVLSTLGSVAAPHARNFADGLKIWLRIPEWRETPPEPPPGHRPVSAEEALARLADLRGARAEDRPGQRDYAAGVARAFASAERLGAPHVVLADAGTGVGKTLGYVAPASVWAEKNQGTVWISTFTRNLQRQLDTELDRLYPDADDKAAHVVVRKGRENYLCLLNFEEAVARLPVRTGGAGRIGGVGDATALGLMARWALASRDGDMVGGDFPAWLADLLGASLTVDLTDTRGECIYAACPHYGRCFIEHSTRRARHARIVVANHALVMIQAALGGDEDGLPTRIVYDEGHHLFGAADSAFSARLSGVETADMRRWLVGAEEGSRTRARGLRARVFDLISDDPPALEALDEVLLAARALPAPGWRARLAAGNGVGAAEAFLAKVRQQVYARDPDLESGYDLEAETRPPVAGLIEAAGALETALARLTRPTEALAAALLRLLDTQADRLGSGERIRIEAATRSLARRVIEPAGAWRAMLRALSAETPPEFVDWFSVERAFGRDQDVALCRHWIDPTVPFVQAAVAPANGVVITSATLRDEPGMASTGRKPSAETAAADGGWAAAEARTGTRHLGQPAIRVTVASPFDYPARTRVLVIGDVDRDDSAQVAAAYRELFLAAGGGGLGLFTAISRLKQVHERIQPALEQAGIPLYAQHVDPLDTGTLVDIFRAEEDSCLLGTDAVRDGVDVPGRALRLIVFDRVPWPRPDILHRARRTAFGGRGYDEMLTRLKLKQAFGRLVRRADDKGVFAMLDRQTPSRLMSAFPDGVPVLRLGLKDALAEVRAFLAASG